MRRQGMYLAVPGKSNAVSDQSLYWTFRGTTWSAIKHSLGAKAAAAFTRSSPAFAAVKKR